MGGKHSRNKGARSERQLRDELIRHGWSDVVRVPLSGAVKTRQAYQDDVVGRPPGWGSEIRFENKARATGFDKYYALAPNESVVVSFILEDGTCGVLGLNPTKVLEITHFTPVSELALPTQKVIRSLMKKCSEWIGNAQVLSLKQDRMPFLYLRYRK
jgi:Holliday junction resolvase